MLIRALGVGTNAEIVNCSARSRRYWPASAKMWLPIIRKVCWSFTKNPSRRAAGSRERREPDQRHVFDPRRYDLAKVGRYKFNKKLSFRNRIRGHVLAEDVVNTSTGEIIAEKGTTVTRELADDIQYAAVPYVWIQTEERTVKVLSNMMVDITRWVDVDPKEVHVTEEVYYPVLEKILEEHADLEEIKEEIRRQIHDLIPKHITKDDIFASINYNMHLEHGLGNDDDIDHLGNRRIRAVGELLQNQYRIGLSRLERVVRERMTTQDLDTISPQSLINIKPVTAAVKEFFGHPSCLSSWIRITRWAS